MKKAWRIRRTATSRGNIIKQSPALRQGFCCFILLVFLSHKANRRYKCRAYDNYHNAKGNYQRVFAAVVVRRGLGARR